MNIRQLRPKRFAVTNPDAHLSRRAAIKLIHRHADKVRVFEDLEGYPALMVAVGNIRRLVLIADLSDAQIYAELPQAWRREHYQGDLFRDASLEVANEEFLPPAGVWSGGLSLIRKIWRRFH